ncbi:hypothetical protein FKW77_009361 [Venturia effusa]|uniref:Uncharacterized protein n=1 Tax=Venturia effusa TaxID=50376 RepID=A0A517LBP0_9PEZI|nr:hypothetical protein FKW77_009361 [Venturia effusa]
MSSVVLGSPVPQAGDMGGMPPGLLESITSGGGLAGFAGGAGGLDLGALLGGGGPDNETPVIIAGYAATAEKERALDAAITAIPANSDTTASSIVSVITTAKDVIAALKDSTTKVSAIGTVNLVASSSLTAPGAELTNLFEQTAGALIAKKDAIAKVGKKADVLEVAKGIKEAVKDFTDNIEQHLPPVSKEAAQTEHAKGLASADKIVAAYS